MSALITIYCIATSYSPLFYSDHAEVASRALRLKQGEISTRDFIFLRQIDHPHVLVFALSYLDLFAFGGGSVLLYAGTLAFSLMTIAVLVASLRRSDIGQREVFSATGISLFLLFGPQNLAILGWPFQVTLIGTASLIATGGYFMLGGIPSRWKWMVFAPCFALALLGHGAGVLLIPTLLLVSIQTRRPAIALLALALAVEFAAYAHLYPATPHISASSLVQTATEHPLEWAKMPMYLAYLLGHGITFGLLGNTVDVAVGAIGLVFYLLAISDLTKNRTGNQHLLFLATFGLLACATSVALNIAYEELRQVTPGFDYFYTDRYLIWTGFFWVTTIALALFKYRVAKVVSALAQFAVVTVLAIQSQTTIQLFEYVQDARADVSRNMGCLEMLDICTLARAVGLPAPFVRTWSAEVFERQRQVSPSSIPNDGSCAGGRKLDFETEAFRGRRFDLTAADHTDVNWDHGVSRNQAGFFVSDLNVAMQLKECDVIQFQDGKSRSIVKVDGRNILLDGEPLDPSTSGFPSTIRAITHSR